MSDLAEAESPVPPLLRDRSGVQRVTNIELFFDLVYVFAITQLSHYLLGHADVRGALQAGLLLVMVWLVWSYTTWVTNWLDPELMAVRLLLVVLMLMSLAMSASLPRAFEDLGLWVGGAYAVQQIGRTVFMVIAFAGIRLAGVAGLALLALAAHAIPALAVAACAAVLVTAVAVSDRLPWLPRPAESPGS